VSDARYRAQWWRGAGVRHAVVSECGVGAWMSDARRYQWCGVRRAVLDTVSVSGTRRWWGAVSDAAVAQVSGTRCQT
jgi:hypothetical protein